MKKSTDLERILSKMESVLIAFSGGVDSTFLAAMSKKYVKGRVLLVTAVSETYSREELIEAKKLAKHIGAEHKIIKTKELQDSNFSSNPPERCYYCKRELFTTLQKIARKEGIKYILDASNRDDLKDFRPGSRAKKESGVRSPLQEAGITKIDIRKMSKQIGLPTWDKPSAACLASRVPYGQRITKKILNRVEKAEKFIREIVEGKRPFARTNVRVRSHGNIARIELGQSEIKRILRGDIMKKITQKLKNLGFAYVTVDIEGFRSGSMNEIL